MSLLRTATVEEALAQLAAGRPVLVADNPERENEVDVVLAAQAATPDQVAWIIRHSSGYLCAPMPAARADALGLPLMVPRSQDPRRTAYTVTVDAASGVTTGISAADRARTVAVLADPASGPGDLIRPGHVLPLRAAAGGVLHRSGHTEAAVDMCRLAGLAEVAVIAELVNDDGTMMRLGEACELAKDEGLVVITIADLIAWRRATGDVPEAAPERPMARVHRIETASLPTAYGEFQVTAYRDLATGAEHLALVPAHAPTDRGPGPGDDAAAAAELSATSPEEWPLVRVHSECLTGDALGSLRCDCGPQLHDAMRAVAARGGAVVYLRGHEGRGIGLAAKIQAYALQDRGRDTVAANVELGWPADRREYGAAAAILQDMGLGHIRLLTNNPAKVAGLAAHGIEAVQIPHEVGLDPHNLSYLRAKATLMGHHLTLPDTTAPHTTTPGTSRPQSTPREA